MARLVQVVHIDDIDGTEGANPVEFAIGSDSYTIDLTAANEAELRTLLAPYIAKAEKVARKRAGRSVSSAAKKFSNADVRTWAREAGYTVSDRGRIPTEVLDAYEAAH